MRHPVKGILVQELQGIVASMEKICSPPGESSTGVRIADIHMASCDSNQESRRGDCHPRFDVDIELDESILSPLQVAFAQGKISECLLENQTW